MSQYRIAVVVGSLRKESHNKALAAALARLGPSDVSFETVEIGDLPLYNQDDDGSPSPQVTRLKGAISAAAGVIFVTPEYNRSIPGVLKNALDHASRPYGQSAWAGKPAGIVGASIGAIGTAVAQSHLRTILAYLDMPVLGQPEVYLHVKDGVFDEAGKITSEELGEVQEMIDICEFAVGLSRQLYGLTIASERPGHRLAEYWHPLGPVAVISAFNFPVAVWAWNSAIAAVCGDSMVWKPSSETPLTAIATQKIVQPILERHGIKGLMGLCVGRGSEVGDALIHDARIPLVSATGSCEMGVRVAKACGERYARTILERGTSAHRQVKVFEDARSRGATEREALHAVVDWLIRETANGLS